MKTTFAYQHMSSSPALEEYINKKLVHVERIIAAEASPKFVEFWLKAGTPDHTVEVHLKTQHYNIHCHESQSDMYAACDKVIDKLTSLVRKEKEKRVSNEHKAQSIDRVGIVE
jgi:ribosomal subunit interface protein